MLTSRAFSLGDLKKVTGETTAADLLVVRPVRRMAASGSQMITAEDRRLKIQDGAFVDADNNPIDVTITAGAWYRFELSFAGTLILPAFIGPVSDASTTPITFVEVYAASWDGSDATDPAAALLREGDDINRLDLGDPAEGDHLRYTDGSWRPGVGGGGDMLQDVYDSNGDGKVNAADAADAVPWVGISDKPSTFPPSTHNHDDRYYTESEVDTLLTTKANLVGGLVVTSQLPSLAITDVFTISSQSAMLALSAQRGDVAVRTDLSCTFILATDDPTSLANWKQLPVPPDAVISINSQTGIVVLSAADIGAAAVGHTHPNATTSGAGFMSASDKTKLDGLNVTQIVRDMFVHEVANSTLSQMLPQDAWRTRYINLLKSGGATGAVLGTGGTANLVTIQPGRYPRLRAQAQHAYIGRFDLRLRSVSASDHSLLDPTHPLEWYASGATTGDISFWTSVENDDAVELSQATLFTIETYPQTSSGAAYDGGYNAPSGRKKGNGTTNVPETYVRLIIEKEEQV